MYDRILLPVAPELEADPATDHAADLAKRYDATVYVVSAADTREIAGLGSGEGLLGSPDEGGLGSGAGPVAEDGSHGLGSPSGGTTYAKRIGEATRDRVEAVVDELEAAGVDAEGEARHGRPADVIIETVDDRRIDAVVMASHTRQGVERVLLGSVTERVIRRASVPVVTVPLGE